MAAAGAVPRECFEVLKRVDTIIAARDILARQIEHCEHTEHMTHDAAPQYATDA
jgi:hypothetical protein